MNVLGISRRTDLFGGNWNNGDNASTFNFNLNNGASNVNRNIGTHLAYFVQTKCDDIPMPLGKT